MLSGCLLSQPLLASERTILVMGDSISAAYGMNIELGWVALLERRLRDQAQNYEVINASISGETSGGGLRRLAALLEAHQPAAVIIELGGNDGLRGYPISQLRNNLRDMTERAQAQDAHVLILSMEIPPNMGRRYTQLFRESFDQVAHETGALSSSFLLAGIATEAALMQQDGIHPTAAAQTQIVDNVWPSILELLDRVSEH